QPHSDDSFRRVRPGGGPLRHVDANQSRAGRGTDAAGPTGHRRPVELLRADGRDPPHGRVRGGDGMNRQVDLSTEYLGFSLPHPVVPPASPLTGDIDTLHLLVEAGAPAVVLPSLFEEQVEHDALAIHHGLEFGAGYNAEAPEGYFPELDDYNSGPDDYLELVARAEDELDVPIIASLNGVSPGGWTYYARLMEKVGANAIELNIYFLAADVTET